MTMKISRRQKWTLGVLLGGALALVLFRRPDVVVMDLVRVTPGPLSVTIDEDGMARFRRRVDIAAWSPDACWKTRFAPACCRVAGSSRDWRPLIDERTRLQASSGRGGAIAGRAGRAKFLRRVASREARRERARAGDLRGRRSVEQRFRGSAGLRELRERDAMPLDHAHGASQEERRLGGFAGAARQAEWHRRRARAYRGSRAVGTGG
jgi:hypothetical protein